MTIPSQTNVLWWVEQCRERCANSIRNTATGQWLDAALNLIVKNYREVQQARNDCIDALYVEAMMEMLREKSWLVCLKCVPENRGFIIEGSRSEYDAPCADREVGNGMWLCEVQCMDLSREWPRPSHFAFGNSPDSAVQQILKLVREDT